MKIEVEWKDDKGQRRKAQYEIAEKKRNIFRRLINKLSSKWHDEFFLFAQYENEMNDNGEWVHRSGLAVRKWPEEITRVIVENKKIEFFLANSSGRFLRLDKISKIKIVVLGEGALSRFWRK